MTSAEEEKALVEKKVLEEACGSPFLLRGYLTFRTKDALCFVMEYACGGDLEQLLDRRGRLDISTATFYAAELVSGLQHLHLKGFIHRDVKPENILIDGGGHIKIADFGLAVNKTEGATGYAGTRGYIAPEMLLGQTYNTGVDWFSFGVVLFQMTTGESPFVCQLSTLPGFNLSLTTRDIIEELLCADPQKRLGLNGLIRQHPFFRDIDWEELEALRIQPPYIPGKPPVKVSLPPQTVKE
ncbi:protein kinase C theta type-like isoform X2 [Mixophyes fleayi]|uniref:protein kinase C theta type-like isoform X2 n=1 Tax=Mixophyes fleayi TaxID=3061075 RepID=UPI003F4DB9D5